MKLLAYLVGSLDSWPIGYQRISQRPDGWLIASAGFGVWCEYGVTELMEDQKTSVVTRAQWEAERARIAIKERYSQDGIAAATQSNPEIESHIADLTAIACGKRSKEDQELWDKVAIALAPAVYSECCKSMDAEGYPENWRVGVAKDWIATVDAFMTERAKRMK